jgi:hypothetical protein
MNKVLRSSVGHQACVVTGAAAPTDVLAQTGAAATKQLQDTQRVEQEKALKRRAIRVII